MSPRQTKIIKSLIAIPLLFAIYSLCFMPMTVVDGVDKEPELIWAFKNILIYNVFWLMKLIFICIIPLIYLIKEKGDNWHEKFIKTLIPATIISSIIVIIFESAASSPIGASSFIFNNQTNLLAMYGLLLYPVAIILYYVIKSKNKLLTIIIFTLIYFATSLSIDINLATRNKNSLFFPPWTHNSQGYRFIFDAVLSNWWLFTIIYILQPISIIVSYSFKRINAYIRLSFNIVLITWLISTFYLLSNLNSKSLIIFDNPTSPVGIVNLIALLTTSWFIFVKKDIKDYRVYLNNRTEIISNKKIIKIKNKDKKSQDKKSALKKKVIKKTAKPDTDLWNKILVWFKDIPTNYYFIAGSALYVIWFMMIAPSPVPDTRFFGLEYFTHQPILVFLVISIPLFMVYTLRRGKEDVNGILAIQIILIVIYMIAMIFIALNLSVWRLLGYHPSVFSPVGIYHNIIMIGFMIYIVWKRSHDGIPHENNKIKINKVKTKKIKSKKSNIRDRENELSMREEILRLKEENFKLKNKKD